MRERMAVVGERGDLALFAALDLEVRIVDSAEKGRAAVEQLAQEGYAIIFVTKGMAGLLKETLERYRGSVRPAIVQLTGAGPGMEEAIFRAIGRKL